MKMLEGRKWEDFIHRNTKEGDCQLVSIVNAYYYHTGRNISPILYNRIADKCGCVAGSCIDTKPALQVLGLAIEKSYITLESGYDVLPLEINVWHKYFGLHSILAVDWEPKTQCFRVTNFKHVCSMEGWIFSEDLYHFVIENPDNKSPRWRCRTIGLKK